jgi:uncharacterized protein YndB with AHSA1/START domain
MLCDMVHEVEIAADPATVYRAITTREGQAGFWTPDNSVEPKLGSVAEFRFKAAPVPVRMRIDALEAGKTVRWTCLGEFPGWKDTSVTWDLGPGTEGRGTRLVFRHGDLARAGYPEAALGSVNYTWGQVLGRLKAYAESGKPQPFFG